MDAHLRAWLETVRTSLWFVPTVMSVLAIALAVGLLQQPLPEHGRAWWLHAGEAKDAIDLLATLLGALIPMAALIVSITMVVLTLAAGQLGPRLIRNFMSDRQTQVTLGLFLGTIIYLVIVLRSLYGAMSAEEVPRLAVSVGTVLVLANVAALLFFVHMLARAIISDTMIGRVGGDLDRAFHDGLPAGPAAWEPDAVRPAGEGHPLTVHRSGYVQTADFPALVSLARRLDGVIELYFRPGHYLVDGSLQGRFWGDAAHLPAVELALRRGVVQGTQRNAAQDLEYSIRQLVEIALRALSPGINDEFSALTVLDRLAGALAVAVGRHEAHRVLCDKEGVPRLLRPVSTFRGLCAVAFDQIRQAAAGHPAVQMRLIETAGTLLALARSDDEREVLRLHLDVVMDSARGTVQSSHDLEAMERLYQAARDGTLPRKRG